MRPEKVYRYIQWATGGVGQKSIRAIAKMDHLEIVGAWVSSDAKHGKDIGTIAGIEPIGIAATMHAEEIYALEADIVHYAPALPNWPEVIRLLESGKNVISPLHFTLLSSNPELMRQLHDAGIKGNASYYGTGIYPDWASTRLVLLCTAASGEIRKISLIEQNAKVIDFGAVEPIIFDILRFGSRPEDAHEVSIASIAFHDCLRQELKNVGAGLGYEVEPFTPERVAARAQIPASQIEQAAHLLGTAKKAALGTGTGNNMAAFSNTAEHLVEALIAVLGAYILAGDEIPNPGIFIPRPDVEMVIPPNRTWEHEPKCISADFGKIMGEFPASLFPDEVLATGPQRIRALFCTGANPAMCLGEPDRVHEALDALDLLVTFDPRPNSATAQRSHYVIPPTLQFERAEVTTFTEGCFPVPFIQYTDAVVEPPPGVMGEQEFFWRLARRLGMPLTFKHIPFGGSYEDVPGGLPIDMETMPSRESLIRWLVEQTPVSFETLQAHPHGYIMDVRKTLGLAETDTGARLDLCPADVREEIRAVEAREPEHKADSYLLTVRRYVESFNSSLPAYESSIVLI